MLMVGDYVTGMSYLGCPVTGRVTSVSPVSVMVDDGAGERYCLLEEVHKTETPIPNEDVMLDEFDEGGLKKMPDGTLESVHIPTEKEAMIPYTATGTGGPPKPKPPVLEWKVEKAMYGVGECIVGEYIVYLMVDGKRHGVRNTCNCRGWFRSVSGRIAEAKKQLMSAYEICLKESGRVE